MTDIMSPHHIWINKDGQCVLELQINISEYKKNKRLQRGAVPLVAHMVMHPSISLV